MKKYLFIVFAFIVFASCKNKSSTAIDNVDTSKVGNDKIPFKNYLGINLFEWDYVENNAPHQISQKKLNIVKGFGAIRHYLDWRRIEPTEGSYTFNPSHDGGWYYDDMYAATKAENIDILVCLKTLPDWLLQTYPASERDPENVPAPWGSDRSQPASYIAQAKAGFQFAARYGSNNHIAKDLIAINTSQRWPNDEINVAKTGLNLVKYIECDNERDKWWKGAKAEQSAEEYAANMSAFYDGHKGALGKNVGVKTADPNMKVVIAGLSVPDPNYIIKMIEWCKENRGFKPDGTVDLCFDVINYHIYPNDSAYSENSQATVGVAPELTPIGDIADNFLNMSKQYANNMEVWMTETGYDVGDKTIQRAIPIGDKSVYVTQADWNLRTALLYARHKINRNMFYMLDDVDIKSTIQYTSSGFVNPDYSPRPTWYYTQQVKSLLGDYNYDSTLSNNPIVDVYKNDNKTIYALTVPDQIGRTEEYTLDLGKVKNVKIHHLQSDKEVMKSETANTNNGKLAITVTETPVFVEIP